MSQKYPGGFITKTPTAPTSSAAPGIWTLDQAMQNQKAGNWPSPPSPYIEDFFSTYLYTGNSSTQTITNGINLSANGGMVWGKSRTAASSHNLYDTVRGASLRLAPNLTNAQANTSPAFSSFNSNGFSLNGASDLNNSGDSIVSWTFAKRQKFFDIVTYTGNGTNNRAIAHNLGSTPGCVIVKSTSNAQNWPVYHRSTGANTIFWLNATNANTSNTGYFPTTPDATSFYVGTDTDVNQSGYTYVAYLFAHNAGGFGLTGTDNVISCGSFTTVAYNAGLTYNASVTLGFEPQFILAKNTSGVGNWFLADNMRGMPVSSNSANLVANTAGAENSSAQWFSPNATGFQTVQSSFDSSSTYIYIAIRRGPMKVPTAATTVFSLNQETTSADPQTLTTGFPVDLSIFKIKTSSTSSNNVVDRLRGGSTTYYNYLTTNRTDAESTGTGTGIGFANNTAIVDSGFNVTAGTIFWIFRRAPSFFDEVCYTGTGSATTVTHNLGVAPELMIVKSRSNGGLGWYVYSTGLGPTKCNLLNQTNGQFTSSTYWNDTAPTSSVFTLGSGGTNGSGNTQVAYLFATCPGVSKVGSYTGNGSSQTINCGFTTGSRFVLIKRTDTTGDWYVWDSARGIVAGNDPYLLLNSTAAEVTGTDAVDTDSTGFIVNRLVAVDVNENAGTYIFLAIA